MNPSNSVIRNLSKQAKEEYQKMQEGMRVLLERDRVREPKLTGEEKARIAKLDAQAVRLNARLPQLEKERAAYGERLKELTVFVCDMVVSRGEDAAKLAQEMLLVKQTVSILDGALGLAYSERGQAENEILTIKNAARKRELVEEG